MTFPTPREFQTKTLESLRAGFRSGHRTQIVMAPTGAGKTMISMYLISECLKKGKKALFVADRKTLINQTSEVADSYGLTDHGIIQADHWRNNEAPFQICSIQTLARRGFPPADLCVIDEVHSVYKAWTHHVKNSRAAFIGLSATPFSPGLGKLFTNLVNAETMHNLTEQGILVPMRVLTGKEVTRIDMEGAATKKDGEWTDEAASERGMKIIGDVVTEWTKHAFGMKTIVFGSTINHCEAMCRQFNQSGIWAATFTERTTDKERAELLEEFRKPDSQLKVLISVEALAKGFDVPDIECLCDCRPMRKSLGTVIQMWGRGLRSHPGKKILTLLDFSGNRLRFAEDFEKFYYEGLEKLSDGKKLDKKIRKDEKKEPRPCPKCGATPWFSRCVSCGFQLPKQEKIVHTAGELVEFSVGKHKVPKADLWVECLTLMVRHGKKDTAEGAASHLFKSIAGAWPPRDRCSVAELPEIGAISQAVVNKHRQRCIAWRHRKAS